MWWSSRRGCMDMALSQAPFAYSDPQLTLTWKASITSLSSQSNITTIEISVQVECNTVKGAHVLKLQNVLQYVHSLSLQGSMQLIGSCFVELNIMQCKHNVPWHQRLFGSSCLKALCLIMWLSREAFISNAEGLCSSLAGYGGSYFTPPFIGPLALNFDTAGMREPSNGLARDEVAWVHLYNQTLQLVNDKLKDQGLPLISKV